MNIISKLQSIKEHMPDLQIKEVSFGINKIYIVNIQTVSSSTLTNEFILEYISKRSLLKNEIISSLKKDILNYTPSISFIDIDSKDVMEYLFNGFSIIIYHDECIALETRANLDRGVNEPTSEPTIKGPKDAFNENYNTNIGLIRKRIKDENLYIKELTLGTRSKTKVSIIYMNDIVDKELLNETIEKISSISNDKVLDTYYIKSLISGENKSSFPSIKSTEKPDSIAKALTEGKICIVSENSCNVLIIPTFFIDYFHNDEDVYQKFTSKYKFTNQFTTKKNNKYYIDLQGIVKYNLEHIGITNIIESDICTYCHHDSFHSYRYNHTDKRNYLIAYIKE